MVRKLDLDLLRGFQRLAIMSERSAESSVPFRFVLIAAAGWMKQRQLQMIVFLREKNQVLREQPGGRRLRLNDDQRRRLAAKPKAWDGSFWPK
jgi:hypothetical protein